MITLPSPAEYERMSESARREAVELLRQVEAANHLERTRREDARMATASVDTAHVYVQATRLLPDIIAKHGDTPALQYERRAALAADVDGYRKAVA